MIEELGDITSSGAIVNYNLCKIIAKNNKNCAILTLDNVSQRIQKDWSVFGDLFFHPKNNSRKYQTTILKFSKLKALICTLIGNDFDHYNRIKNIQKFLKNNKNNYQKIIFLSGGTGFSPHRSISRIKFSKDTILIGVYHDPYPISCYPEPYNKGARKLLDFFKIRNTQKSFVKLDHIVFPSKRLYEWYLKDYDIVPKKVKIVPHAVQFNLKNNVGLKNKKTTIRHVGTLLEPRNPFTFLKCVASLKSNYLEVEFIGKINKNVKMDIINFNDQENIFITDGRIPYNEALQKLNNTDFTLLIESDALFNPFLPTKFVDYVNVGKPIIVLSSKKSEVSRLLGEEYPFKTTLNNNDEIFEILENKIYSKEAIFKANEKIIELKSYFSEKNILNLYAEIFNNSNKT